MAILPFPVQLEAASTELQTSSAEVFALDVPTLITIILFFTLQFHSIFQRSAPISRKRKSHSRYGNAA
jgi:hypothetical protein